jgi:hypothetical protein
MRSANKRTLVGCEQNNNKRLPRGLRRHLSSKREVLRSGTRQICRGPFKRFDEASRAASFILITNTCNHVVAMRCLQRAELNVLGYHSLGLQKRHCQSGFSERSWSG